GLQSPAVVGPLRDAAQQYQTAFSQLSSETVAAATPPTISVASAALTALERLQSASFLDLSGHQASVYGATADVAAYYSSPRITISSEQLASNGQGVEFALDLRRNGMSVFSAAGQNTAAVQAFNEARGLFDTAMDDAYVPSTGTTKIATIPIFQ